MKLTSTTVAFIAALATAAVASETTPNHPIGKFPKREANILGQIQENINQAASDVQNFFGIGHADDNEASGADTPTAADEPTTKATRTSRSSSSSSSGNNDAASTDSAEPTDDASSAANTKSTKTSSSSSSESPTPSGDPCSTDKEMRCPSGSALVSTYQQCLDGVWTNQSCDNNNVCGKDNKGNVACVSKEQATKVDSPCSNKGEVQCDATNPNKYQSCDGSNWQTGSCNNNLMCKIVNSAPVCINSDEATQSGAASDYTIIEPSAFVPESAAPLKAKAALASVTAALALALAAVSWGF
ncbi:hypothetical protein IW140_002201 [Coemansia sp. RSA 1813]|nr:hypothetical protein EV178_001709 [Coemansia sp. RSA 1646]KAJ1770555.1 hypothetical protein LPJ74_003082 [Coemansia sp. RSA 1843]KAJ2092976.1 hypothetical protein IW138_000690 [Coemansia sp. RSA 986]KAJ2216297.1 hypothetical protein EV179_001536 [Coemansia sp. RSA 487]KAJ2570530.1 hypothetical protein IW140_002201 [Coemansia sp. RSA 1813]